MCCSWHYRDRPVPSSTFLSVINAACCFHCLQNSSLFFSFCFFPPLQVLEKVDVEQKMSIRFLHWILSRPALHSDSVRLRRHWCVTWLCREVYQLHGRAPVILLVSPTPGQSWKSLTVWRFLCPSSLPCGVFHLDTTKQLAAGQTNPPCWWGNAAPSGYD